MSLLVLARTRSARSLGFVRCISRRRSLCYACISITLLGRKQDTGAVIAMVRVCITWPPPHALQSINDRHRQPRYLFVLQPSTMPPRPVRTPKLEQQLPPILALLTETPPNAYSAHQKALTTTARLVQSGHGPIAIDILFQVARELLKLGEAASGVELGVRMVEIMGETKVPVEDSSKGTTALLGRANSSQSHPTPTPHTSDWPMAQEAGRCSTQVVGSRRLSLRRPGAQPISRRAQLQG